MQSGYAEPTETSTRIPGAVVRAPARSLVSFELPVVTSSTATAVSVVGGSSALREITSALPTSAIAYLRPEDVFCHGVVGRRELADSSLLLRLTPPAAAGGAWLPTIVGQVTTTYAFDSVADFQFLGASAASCPNFSAQAESLAGATPGFAVPPAEFVTTTALSVAMRRDPRVYLKVSSGAAAHAPVPATGAAEEAGDDGASGDEDAGQALALVKPSKLLGSDFSMLNAYFGECADSGANPVHFRGDDCSAFPLSDFASPDDVPSKPCVGATPSDPRKLAIVERLRRAFELRPMWTNVGLMQLLAPLELKSFRFLIAAVAYYIRYGPFSSNWVRLGYDPRKFPESRLYQSIEIRYVGRAPC